MQKITELLERGWQIQMSLEDGWLEIYATQSGYEMISAFAEIIDGAVDDLYDTIKRRYPLQWE